MELKDLTEDALISEVIKEIHLQKKMMDKQVAYLSSGEQRPVVDDLLNNSTVKTAICKSLKLFTGDLWDMAKAVTPVFLTLELSGTYIIPTPEKIIFIALIVLNLFYRIGLERYCV